MTGKASPYWVVLGRSSTDDHPTVETALPCEHKETPAIMDPEEVKVAPNLATEFLLELHEMLLSFWSFLIHEDHTIT